MGWGDGKVLVNRRPVLSLDRFPSYQLKGTECLMSKTYLNVSVEMPLAIVDRGKTKIWYPDFRLPEYGMIIEYFGIYKPFFLGLISCSESKKNTSVKVNHLISYILN